jgi:hypothetical protein
MQKHVRFRRLGLLAVAVTGIATRAQASAIVYQNTTNLTGTEFVFNGAATVGSDLAANIDINELALSPGSAGQFITSLSFLAANANAGAVEARPTIYIWAADGAGGIPGALLGDFALPIATLGAGIQELSFTLPGSGLLVPASMQIWAGIGFDNDNGTSPITAAELNDLGGLTYHPATVGADGADAYFLPPGASLNDPAAILFNSASGANYGWTVQAEATPEPSSLFLLSTVLLALAFAARKRIGRIWSS